MKLKLCTAIAATSTLTFVAGSVHAATVYDADVTPDVIFGSGNANGFFTVETGEDRLEGVELGLRAKLRFDDANQPQNVFNSNGDGTYTFLAGQPPVGFGFAPGSSSTAVWNFEWSVNTDTIDGTRTLSSLQYQLAIDFDPGAGTDFQIFDPINVDFADHAIGNNATGNGDGLVAGNIAEYAALIAQNNVAQNSWNMEFFDTLTFPFNANNTGIYDIVLTATDPTVGQSASTSIQILVVPSPTAALGSLALLGGLAGAGLMRRRRSGDEAAV